MIQFATDVFRNRAFWKAAATTRDALGLRVLDYVRSPAERLARREELNHLIHMSLDDFASEMEREPVRLSSTPKPDGSLREIVVPTFRRRAISNLLNATIQRTSNHLLPGSVRAYRPRSADAVQQSILDAAEAVQTRELRFFAKLDFRSFFSQVRWDSIASTLCYYGFDEAFTAYVLAVVKCPIVQRKNGRLVAIKNEKGAQMGLPESSTIANMVPWSIDRELSGSNHLFYSRYSDDILVGSKHRDATVFAVRRIAQWCNEHGLSLKNVDRHTRLSGLVLDVNRSKIAFLGAEIDQYGHVHMPKAKLHEKLADLDYLFSRLASDRVHGVSRFGDGGGVDAFDAEDFHQSVLAFLDYWSLLDPLGTERARVAFNKRYPLTPVTSAAGRGSVWIARLWGDRAEREAGMGLASHKPDESSETSRPKRQRMSPSATCAYEEEGSPSVTRVEPHGHSERTRMSPSATAARAQGCFLTWTEAGGSSPPATEDSKRIRSVPLAGIGDARDPLPRRNESALTPGESDDRQAPRPTLDSGGVADGSDSIAPMGSSLEGPDVHRQLHARPCPTQEVASASDADRRKSYRFDISSVCESTCRFVCRRHVLLGSTSTGLEYLDDVNDLPILSGAADEPAPGASPPAPDLENSLMTFVHTLRFISRRRSMVVVGVCKVVNGRAWRPCIQLVEDCRPEAALVHCLTSAIRRKSSTVLGMESTWLTKALLQPHRRFRAPLLFGAVLELHQAARDKDVQLVGGVPVPTHLLRAMRRRLDAQIRDDTG
jgi:hypothetical protein